MIHSAFAILALKELMIVIVPSFLLLVLFIHSMSTIESLELFSFITC